MNKHPLNDFLDFVSQKHGEENWVTLYRRISTEDASEDGGFYSALISQEKTELAMSEPGWDLMLGSGGPGFSTYFEDGQQVTSYHRFSDEDFRRLVLYRDFHGRKNNYFEILEEFRLLHNLYFDQKTSTYMAFDDAGDEVDVVKVMTDEIKVRRSYLKAFMAATQTNLLLYFELTRHFKYKQDFSDDERSDRACITSYSGDSYVDGYESFTRVLGKKLIHCDVVDACGIWPYERQKNYEDFIIGGDVDAAIKFSCNPDLLANYFGDNKGSPHYLTPIFFKKEVMQKYYGSSEYEITDGHLSRNGAWSLRFDNNHSGHISVFLGDLGKDLPEKEQTYWKSFNILPDGRRISETNFQRSFMGRFFDPENPEHRFKSSFESLQQKWLKVFGWNLFLPLAEKDYHFFSSIRSMLTDEQSEFDALILSIAKITIDSVNIKELRRFLDSGDDEGKSIVLLEATFKKLGLTGSDEASAFLRGVQSVRSTGVAHRKGTEYDKVIARLNIDEDNYKSEFDEILTKFVLLFDGLFALIPTASV